MRINAPEPLKLLQVIARYGEVKGRLALHKLVHDLQVKGVLSTQYKFINYSFGPYSKELEDDLRLLQSLGLIIEQRSGDGSTSLRLSRRGEEVIKSMAELRIGAGRIRV